MVLYAPRSQNVCVPTKENELSDHNRAKGLTYDVEDGIDRLQPGVTIDAERKVAARLDATIGEAIAEVVIGQVFFLYRKQLATNVELHIRKR